MNEARCGRILEDKEAMRVQNHSDQLNKGRFSRIRREPRLVLPAKKDRQPTDGRLKVLIDEWIAPRLVQEFLRERGLDQAPPGDEKNIY